ncbi:unnamed protein product [Larinioides sclopetarius]|uniref:Uncharacterized protein n=1 Tax=Larinioides sclopetarius TaxID=280406 RepID=A0AAV1Z4A1_9ARAC
MEDLKSAKKLIKEVRQSLNAMPDTVPLTTKEELWRNVKRMYKIVEKEAKTVEDLRQQLERKNQDMNMRKCGYWR